MDTIIRTTVMCWVLLAVLRLIGPRAASQLTPFEFIVIFLLGGMTIQAIVVDDRSLVNALTGILSIAANHAIASALKQKFPFARKLIDGTPVVVVEDGKVDQRRLAALRMSKEDLLAAAREKGAKHLSDIYMGIVKRDGSITIFKTESY